MGAVRENVVELMEAQASDLSIVGAHQNSSQSEAMILSAGHEGEPRTRFIQASKLKEAEIVMPLVKRVVAQSRFGDIPFSEEKFNKQFAHVLAQQDQALPLYVLRGDKPVAMMYSFVGEYFLGQGVKLATVQAFVMDPAFSKTLLGGKVALRLLRVTQDWAKVQGARELHIHATAGLGAKQTDRFFQKLGFTTIGGNYGVGL